MVLGQATLDLLTEIFTQLDTLLTSLTSKPVVICSAPGSPGLIHPALQADVESVKAALETAKGTFVEDPETNIVSQLAWVDRGGE